MKSTIDYKKLCTELLHAESEQRVLEILTQYNLTDHRNWKILGDMPNNRAMVNNQQQDPIGAMVEKVINQIDAVLTKACFLAGINPDDQSKAPKSMAEAAETFFKIKDGNLANLLSTELTDLTDQLQLQLVATGIKSDPCYLLIDSGEGQTPLRFEETFLSLRKSNKARIPFVQGRFNCGGTGVLPFCGREAFELIISRRCPQLPSGITIGGAKDASHDLWGFTLVRRMRPSEGPYDTTTYVYLAPDGQVPSFAADELMVLPAMSKQRVGDESEFDAEVEKEEEASTKEGTPKPYAKGLKFGTAVKLYNYQWTARSVATTDVRFALEKYLYQLSLPLRVVETRPGYSAHYLATTVSGTAVTIAKDKEKKFLEDNFPFTGEINPENMSALPITVALYRETPAENTESEDNGPKRKRKVKDPRRLPKGLSFTINGQVHYSVGSEFFFTRGLKYDYIKDTLIVVVDCTYLPQDIRDTLIMPSRDRLRKLPDFDLILEKVVAYLKDQDALRRINDERRMTRVQAALQDDSTQNVLQSLVSKDPIFASLFGSGLKLRNPWTAGPTPKPFTGKLPPTFFQFESGKHNMEKSFPIDRTCSVELATDAVNDYFQLPDPNDRGVLNIEPKCYERWHLLNGTLRIVFRAPSNARIGDRIPVKITVSDPNRALLGKEPWTNHLTLLCTEGGKETKSGGERKKPQMAGGTLGLPNIQLVQKEKWPQHNFSERSALRITTEENGSEYTFWVNMDNIYLHNELMRRNAAEKEAAKFAFKWGLVLIALGMIQELKKDVQGKTINGTDSEEQPKRVEDQVSEFSKGVAAVVIPTVLHLMDAMKGLTKAEATAA
jgi:hypothetical protein